jgi:hypothetical protein
VVVLRSFGNEPMNITSLKKRAAQLVMPRGAFERLQAIRSRRFQLRFLARQGLLDASLSYIERNGVIVKYGPFAGTVYPMAAATSRHAIPKLLGTYEQELHHIIDACGRRRYDVIIDIGSAEGYYAVGLAKLLHTQVLAYEPEPIERSLCAEAARLNGVEGLVEMRELFRPSDISLFRECRVLCVCDCEGFEAKIFTPQTVADVAKWDILVELHGEASEKLAALHWPQATTVISSGSPRSVYPELAGLGDQGRLLSEYRTERQRWLWCDGDSDGRGDR